MSGIEHHFDPQADQVMRAAVDLSSRIIDAYNQGQLWDRTKAESVAKELASERKFDTKSTEMLIAAVPSLLNHLARLSREQRSSTRWWLAAAAVVATMMVTVFLLWPRSSGWNCASPKQRYCGAAQTAKGLELDNTMSDFVIVGDKSPRRTLVGGRILEKRGTRYVIRSQDEYVVLAMITGEVTVRLDARSFDDYLVKNYDVALLRPGSAKPWPVKARTKDDLVQQGVPLAVAESLLEARWLQLKEIPDILNRWNEILPKLDPKSKERLLRDEYKFLNLVEAYRDGDSLNDKLRDIEDPNLRRIFMEITQ